MKPTKPPKPTPPAPGEPRPCKTGECGTLFIPGKTGAGEYCYRCNAIIAKGGTPGPRQRQPPGKAKQRVRAYVLPEMLNALTPEVLASFKVESPAEFLVLGGARLLGRKDFEPKKPRARR